MAQRRKKRTAIVQCQGNNCRQTDERCRWGCTGCGSCVEACRLQAVSINEQGIAEIDRERCAGCGLCAKACPQGVIRITDVEYSIYPACISQDPGPQTRKLCDQGCIACGICVKNCPMGAITLEDAHAVIDEEKCIACGMCAVKCPRGAIGDLDGIFTVRKEQVVS